MLDNILEARNITYIYADGTIALDRINMSIPRGKKIAVIGANGAGKSTLFLHFNGLNKPKSGEIFFDSRQIGYSNHELVKLRKEVGIVFQEPDHQLFSSSVMQEISFGPINLKHDRAMVLQKVETAMEATGISEFKHKPTHFLSYGQKKRVAIASILAMEPSVLILDEPTSGLDQHNADMVIDILNQLNEAGKTILISTHDIDMAYTWADYIYIMNKGMVIGHGAPEEVFVNKELLGLAGIKQPWIIEVFEGIQRENGNRLSLPKSKEQLIEYLKTL